VAAAGRHGARLLRGDERHQHGHPPHVSGLLAAFLSARKEFIGYPDRVRALLLAHCTDLGRDLYIQGRGMPNLVKMLVNT
jgi:hypothetical protein